MLAILYDIHGNLPALEAVLADAEEHGAERYLLGGDYTLFGGWPRETLARLRELDAGWIRGNGERWTADPSSAPEDKTVQAAIAGARQQLGEQAVADLGALAEQTVVDGTRYCHASPVSDVRSFLPEPSPEDDELLDGIEESRLVFGHTHLPFRRQSTDGVELVNPGSVGMPFDGNPRAAYALVDDDGTLELRRVRYDHALAARTVRERFPDFGEVVMRRIESARLTV